MLDTFKARLKAKMLTLGVNNLTPARLDTIAARLHKKFPDLKEDDEKGHDDQIDLFNEIFPLDELAKQDDTIRSLKAKSKEKEKEEKQEEKSGEHQKKEGKDGEKTPEDTPAWAKGLTDTIQTLSQTVATLQKEKTQSSIREKITGNEKMKDIPEAFWRKIPLPEKDDDIDGWIDERVNDHTEYTQGLADKGFQQVSKPVMGNQGGGGKGGNEKVSPAMSEFLKERKEKAAPAATNGQTQKV
jgi:cell division protein ZapA (FtsZ GTPase activity inhibitor)